MSQVAVRLEILEGSVALLTLDQPGSRANTLGQAVQGDLEAAVAQLRSRNDLTGLILVSGKPGMFIAGADLKELGEAKPDPELTRKLIKRGLDLIASFENCRFRPWRPSMAPAWVAVSNWRSVSTSASLAHIRKSELGQPEVKIGLIPGWGGTQTLDAPDRSIVAPR